MKKCTICTKRQVLRANQMPANEKQRYVMTSDLRQYIAEYTVANFWHYPIRRRVTYASALECPFNIPWKANFCLAFYFKWKYFVLVDHILTEAICLLCFCVLFSNIYTKIKVIAKSLSDLCNFYSKEIFRNFCLRKHFLLFFAEFELVMFYNNIVKISEKLNKWNMLKIWLQVTYPANFCIIWLHFYYGKKWKYLIF